MLVGGSLIAAISKYVFDAAWWQAVLVGLNVAFCLFAFPYVWKLRKQPISAERINSEQREMTFIGKLPHLIVSDPQSMGLYDIQPNTLGYGVRVTNNESRYHTVAHNVRASVHLRHTLGDERRVTAIWLAYEDRPDGKRGRLFESVSIGMEENYWLLLLFWDASAKECQFRPAASIPLNYTGQPLEYGEWTAELTLAGENITSKHGLTLTLRPRGAINTTLKQ